MAIFKIFASHVEVPENDDWEIYTAPYSGIDVIHYKLTWPAWSGSPAQHLGRAIIYFHPKIYIDGVLYNADDVPFDSRITSINLVPFDSGLPTMVQVPENLMVSSYNLGPRAGFFSGANTGEFWGNDFAFWFINRNSLGNFTNVAFTNPYTTPTITPVSPTKWNGNIKNLVEKPIRVVYQLQRASEGAYGPGDMLGIEIRVVDSPTIPDFSFGLGCLEGNIQFDAPSDGMPFEQFQIQQVQQVPITVQYALDASGIYVLQPGKLTDTVYVNTTTGETEERAIPNPFFKTGFFGDQ